MIVRCRNCHYSLEGLTEHCCPECGTVFDPNDRSTFEQPWRPTVWHALLLYVAWFLGCGVIVVAMPSARSNLKRAFDTVTEQTGYAVRLIAVISAVLTAIVWLAWYIRWLRFRS